LVSAILILVVSKHMIFVQVLLPGQLERAYYLSGRFILYRQRVCSYQLLGWQLQSVEFIILHQLPAWHVLSGRFATAHQLLGWLRLRHT
jgi:hypothetical protein